jgi:hypothetical protein
MQNRNAETNLLHQILLKCKHKKQKGKQGKCKNPLLDYVVPFSHSSMHHGHGKRVLQVLQNHLRLSFNSYQNDFVEKNQPGKKDCLMMMMLMKRNNASSDFQPTPFCKPDADDAPVKSLILNASDPFYAPTSSLMDCDSTFQAQRLCLHQIC